MLTLILYAKFMWYNVWNDIRWKISTLIKVTMHFFCTGTHRVSEILMFKIVDQENFGQGILAQHSQRCNSAVKTSPVA